MSRNEVEQLVENRRLVAHDSEAPCLSCFVVKHNMQEFFRVVYDSKFLPDTSVEFIICAKVVAEYSRVSRGSVTIR